jgi:hypothetical protein
MRGIAPTSERCEQHRQTMQRPGNTEAGLKQINSDEQKSLFLARAFARR